ncbi:MAG: hypothetical protein QM653_02690 [Dysgonomonas sp.]|uniref:hypothetical protein n=1 Tax=Dysgonomonas sp. TaxID=1891233 RepID=UPI0039E28EFB
MEKVKDYFKRYPVSQEVYENGGVLFHTRGAAESYGTGETKRYTRKDAEGATKAKEELSAEEQARLAEEVKNNAIAKLKATEDLNSLEYQELFKLSQDLGLKTANNKKPTILEALTAEKERLNAE